jgi:hypothetical protein
MKSIIYFIIFLALCHVSFSQDRKQTFKNGDIIVKVVVDDCTKCNNIINNAINNLDKKQQIYYLFAERIKIKYVVFILTH